MLSPTAAPNLGAEGNRVSWNGGWGGPQQWEGDPQDSLETRRPHFPLLRGHGPGTALVELRVILICLFHGQVEDREETLTKQVPTSEVQSTRAQRQGHRHTGTHRHRAASTALSLPFEGSQASHLEDGGRGGGGTEAWVLCVPEEPLQPGACREGFGEGSCPSGQDTGAGSLQCPPRPARPTSDLSLTLRLITTSCSGHNHFLVLFPSPSHSPTPTMVPARSG